MKRIINGKMYNTATAALIATDSYSNCTDFNYWEERLYRKKTGEFFLYGEGGPMTKYSRSIGCNSWRGGEDIKPLTDTAVKAWLEDHGETDIYISLFGEPEE